MLKRLSKWLRIMGYDVEYPGKEIDDTEIIARCENEGRILLTRDHELYARFTRSILVQSEDFKEQAIQIVSSFPPDRGQYFSRCPECNGLLRTLENVEEVPGIPESVRAAGKEVWMCRKCGKTYWKGSHYERIVRQIEKFEAGLK